MESEEPKLPTAVVAPVRGRSWAWVLPVLALLFTAFLIVRTASGRGPRITLHAEEGHGIKVGDPLRYRGITVGEIEGVELARDLSELKLEVRLDPAARGIAREGSRFWIVRPHLALDSVQGVETIIGARYLAVVPGLEGGARENVFTALEEPPVPERIDPNGIVVTLEAPERFGLAPGAPVSYRQIQIGTVLGVGLASDAGSVVISAYVRPAYTPLVCERSRFWSVGGLDIRLGLVRGLKVEMESMRSLLVGGIALATPNDPGAPARSGHRFPLHEEPKEDWLEWRPSLPVGQQIGRPVRPGSEAIGMVGLGMPVPVRAQLRWKQGFLRRKKSRAGWLLLTGGGLIGPTDVITVPEKARKDSVTFEVNGEEFALDEDPVWSEGALASIRQFPADARVWPDERVRTPLGPEDCLAVGDPTAGPLALDAARLEQGESGWTVNPEAKVSEAWHGAPVVARGDGALVGILVVGKQSVDVVFVPN